MFADALRERVMAGDTLAIQCAYLLGLWNDGLDEDACTQVETGEEPCGVCYWCQTRQAAQIDAECALPVERRPIEAD